MADSKEPPPEVQALADEFFDSLECDPQEPKDNEGRPIKEFVKVGFMLKPLTAVEMGEVSKYAETNGRESAYKMILICGVVNRDGKRVFTTDDAPKFDNRRNGPLERAVSRIQRITGNDYDPKEGTTLSEGGAT